MSIRAGISKHSGHKPFWNRIPSFFIYGFKPAPLILACIIGGASYFVGNGLWSLLLMAIILKYSMVALQQTSDSDLTPPPLNIDVLINNYELPTKLYLLFATFFLAVFALVTTENQYLVIAAIVGGILLMPAVVISLAFTESFFYALNPLNSIALVGRIGWPYLAMAIFLFLFSSIEGGIQYFLMTNAAPKFVEPLFYSINAIFTVICFHMMGYVLLQYREKLGYQTTGEIRDRYAPAVPDKLALLQNLIDEGKSDAAIAEMERLIKAEPDDHEPWRRLYVYLVTNGRTDRLGFFVPGYIGFLLDKGKTNDAANVYRDSLERGQTIKLHNSFHYLPMMQELRRKRDAKNAVLLANGFHKQFPRNQAVPGVYLEMAKILCEDLQRDDLAMQALGYIIKEFPLHELTSEARKYYSMLQKLRAAAPTA